MELFELKQIPVTSQCHSCWRHLPEGLTFCECGVCLRPDEEFINRVKSKISSFDSTVFSCTSESFKREHTRRFTMAGGPLESNRRQKRSTETLAFLDIEQVGEWRAAQNFSVESWVDSNLLSISGPPYNGWHLPQRVLSSKEFLRKHNQDEK